MGVVVRLTEDKVDLGRLAGELASTTSMKGAGALVVFMGFVKGVVGGARVKELVYEAHIQYALDKLREIGINAEEKYKLHEVVIIHRVGRIQPGEPTVYILVAAESRREAFKAAEEILERVKHEAPIYKLERREDGEYWVMGDGRRIRRPRKQA